MKILHILYSDLLEHLKDLKSHRIILNWVALILFIFCILNRQPTSVIAIVGSWNSLIFGFYFTSKYNEAKFNLSTAIGDPTLGIRNPDDI